jgi:hypothetical protein
LDIRNHGHIKEAIKAAIEKSQQLLKKISNTPKVTRRSRQSRVRTRRKVMNIFFELGRLAYRMHIDLVV